MPTGRAREKDPSTVGIKAVADDVLQVELEAPSPHFLKLLTHISFLPLHPSLLHSTDWGGGATVIGNGPFVLKSRSDTEIVLAKSPTYWDAKNVGMDTLRVRFIDDAADATDAYITGKVQWVTASLVNSDKLIATDRLEVYPMFGTTYFFFSCDQAPWNDWRVRRGIALMVPWDQVRSRDDILLSLRPADPLHPRLSHGERDRRAERRRREKAACGCRLPRRQGPSPVIVKLAKDSNAKTYVQKMADAWKRSSGCRWW